MSPRGLRLSSYTLFGTIYKGWISFWFTSVYKGVLVIVQG